MLVKELIKQLEMFDPESMVYFLELGHDQGGEPTKFPLEVKHITEFEKEITFLFKEG